MRRIIVALLLVVFCISPAMAVDYTFGDDVPVDIIYDGNDDFTGFDFLVAYAGTTDEIQLFDPSGMGSQSLKVDNLPSDIRCIAILDGDIIAGFSNGDVIRFDTDSGIFDYSTAGPENMQLISQIPYACEDIIVDGNNNIYASGSKYIYKFSAPYYSQATLLEDSNGYLIGCLANHPEGLLYGTGNGATQQGKIKLYSGSSSTTIYDITAEADFDIWTGVITALTVTADKDIYFNSAIRYGTAGTHQYGHERLVQLDYVDGSYQYGQTIYYKNYGDFGSSSSSAFNAPYTQGYKDLIVDHNGVIFTVQPYTDKISTFSTVGLISGYYPTASDDTSSDQQNPLLVDYNNDGEFTQVDAKGFALDVGPMSWILMLMIFLMAAMKSSR